MLQRFLSTVLLALACTSPAFAADAAPVDWWIWPLALFVACFALGIIAELFPKRKVVGIHSVDFVLGLGTIHCSTQQEPLTADR